MEILFRANNIIGKESLNSFYEELFKNFGFLRGNLRYTLGKFYFEVLFLNNNEKKKEIF